MWFSAPAPSGTVATTVSAAATLYPAAANLLGVNTAYWDADAVTAQTEQLVQAAGLSLYRFPGGGAADEFHFNIADNLGDSAAITVAQFAQFLASVGGTGVLTVDYGSGSPQEAAAELAYLMESPSDTTPLGAGHRVAPRSKCLEQHELGYRRLLGFAAGRRAAGPGRRSELSGTSITPPRLPRSSIGKSAMRYTEAGRSITTARPVPAA